MSTHLDLKTFQNVEKVSNYLRVRTVIQDITVNLELTTYIEDTNVLTMTKEMVADYIEIKTLISKMRSASVKPDYTITDSYSPFALAVKF